MEPTRIHLKPEFILMECNSKYIKAGPSIPVCIISDEGLLTWSDRSPAFVRVLHINDLPLVFNEMVIAKDFIETMPDLLQNIIIQHTNLMPWELLKYEGEVFRVTNLITL